MDLSQDIEALPTHGVADYVAQLAKAHRIRYRRSALDAWAEAVSRAEGDDVTTDETLGLLIRLSQRNVLNDAQFIRLIVNYRREQSSAGGVVGATTDDVKVK